MKSHWARATVKRWDLLRDGRLLVRRKDGVEFAFYKSWITLWLCLDGKRNLQQLARATGFNQDELELRLEILKKIKLLKKANK